ncbi:SORTING NEXIN [Ceraceosorus bombacis]|uniref:SORTING NEXIN n=1 Tax=Ceraceosorus bombacis TaxID=401625 RepID=A0A0N7L9C7_9BASI|nr:SORTING NEXIN [Ceraceosorus bombacis]
MSRTLTEAERALDHELALLLTHALRLTILPWYSKLTPDRELFSLVTLSTRSILCHLAQVFSQGANKQALRQLWTQHLPHLLKEHIANTRFAQREVQRVGQASVLAQTFLEKYPHVALSTSSSNGSCLHVHVDSTYLAVLLEHFLDAVIPTEHLESDCERYLLRDLLMAVLSGAILQRTIQPWFLVQSFHKWLDSRETHTSAPPQHKPNQLALWQSVAAHLRVSLSLLVSLLSSTFLAVLRAYFDLFDVSFIAPPYAHGARTRAVAARQGGKKAASARTSLDCNDDRVPSRDRSSLVSSAETGRSAEKRGNRSAKSCSMAAWVDLFEMLLDTSSRICSRLSMTLLHLLLDLGLSDAIEDKLSRAVFSALDPEQLAKIVPSLREAMFPDGKSGPPAPPAPAPDQAEQEEEYERLVVRLAGSIPTMARMALLGPDERSQLDTLHEAFGPFLAPPLQIPTKGDDHAPSHKNDSLSELANCSTLLRILEQLLLVLRLEPCLQPS